MPTDFIAWLYLGGLPVCLITFALLNRQLEPRERRARNVVVAAVIWPATALMILVYVVAGAARGTS